MAKIQERNLTKGQLRKLNALRKSLGQDIADSAFAEWLASSPKDKPVSVDTNVEAIVDLLNAPVLASEIRIPRGGYVVKRGRGRVVVERAQA